MDTPNDFAQEGRIDTLNATPAGFTKWLEENEDGSWDEYLDDLEYAREAKMEVVLR
jgi:hypothetical protein